MAQNLLTPQIIAKEALMHLENEMEMCSKVSLDYSKEFVNVGDTITARKPVRFSGQSDNLDLTNYNEDIESGGVDVKMDKTESVKFSLNAKERTLEISDPHIQEYLIEPAVIKIKDRIESELGKLYKSVAGFSGTPGTTPATFKALGLPAAKMTDAAVPKAMRCAFHNPDAALELTSGLQLVQMKRDRIQTALERNMLGDYAGFDNYESVHVPTHVVGDYGGTPLINGGSQGTDYVVSRDTNTQTLVTDGWTADKTGLLLEGDVFTIAGVQAVNPISKQSTGRLQDFVVRADANSDGSGNATLTISPAIIPDGPYQTVTAAPADNAAITVVTGEANGSYRQSILMHKKAFIMVTRPLDIPDDSFKTYTVSGKRMSISVSESTDFNTLKKSYRLDVLFGTKAIYPELAQRLTS